FSLVSVVIPAACPIERVGTAGPEVAIRIPARDTGCALRRVTRRPRPLLPHEPRLDRSAGAAVVEIFERIVGQPRIDVVGDGKGAAGLAAGDEAVAGPGPAKCGEIDAVHMLAR